MASNAFGNVFKIMTWGESHGEAIGVLIDGCPAGLDISAEEISAVLSERAPGHNPYTSPRKESDQAQLLSGVFEGKTTGAPISILIKNQDADTSKYEPIKDLLRPGHANYTYQEKYGVFDYRGGGRASARETAARVAAAAVAEKILNHCKISVVAYLKQVGEIKADISLHDLSLGQNKINDNVIFCPEEKAAQAMMALLEKIQAEGDSLGGIVEFAASGVPVGLGDPVYEKLEANLAKAMMSLPATKGFEIGEGFACVTMKGSQHNDAFVNQDGKIHVSTNHAGGILGGISSGQMIVGRVAFKPTSSIKKPQHTTDSEGNPAIFTLPTGSRHDPCVAIRAVPVVKAMLQLVLVDALLMNRLVKL